MHDKFEDETVVYLEISEFDTNGNFIKEMHGKSMIVMMGATFCPHCTESAAPMYRGFASENFAKPIKDKTKVIAAVVYADGSSSERQVASLLSNKVNERGIPMFIFFDSDGVLRSHKVGTMSLAELHAFIDKNMDKP
jgi:hypothetical protein